MSNVNVQALSTALAGVLLPVLQSQNADLTLQPAELPLGVLLDCPVAAAVADCWLAFRDCNTGNRTPARAVDNA